VKVEAPNPLAPWLQAQTDAAQRQPSKPLAKSVKHSLDERRAFVQDESSQLQATVLEINQEMRLLQRHLSFSVDEDSGRTVVKVIDTKTEEVIRQIPAEHVLSIARIILGNADLGIILNAET
jgi:flagellar protein FlaG